MSNGESSPRDHEHLPLSQPAPGASAVITTAPEDRFRDTSERSPARALDDRGPLQQQAQRQPSMIMHVMITAVVALACGALGAMGYSHFAGSRSGDPSSSHSNNTETGAGNGMASGSVSRQGSNADSAHESSVTAPGPSASSPFGARSGQDADGLQEQIKTLNRKIDQFGAEIERIEQQLSLAVPLLQRIAPKS